MQYSMLPRSLLRLLLSLSVLLLIIISTASAYSTPCTIQVCQDKNCCKRFTGKASDLVQTLRQLSSHDTLITIEATTCLSHCDQGPNVRINDQEVQNNVESATSAAAMLELNGDVIVVHPTLLAACNVMERAHKATTLKEKERFLNSVIKALEKEDHLALSKSMAHALVMRAQARLADSVLLIAREDAIRAAELDPLHPKVWRVLADASPDDPTEALQQWAHHQPQFATKVKKEIAQYYINNERRD